MTLSEFMEKLGGTPRTWKVMGNGMIRMMGGTEKYPFGSYCPITSLAKRCPIDEWEVAAKELGMDKDEAALVADAADNMEWAPAGIRKELLRACGLEK